MYSNYKKSFFNNLVIIIVLDLVKFSAFLLFNEYWIKHRNLHSAVQFEIVSYWNYYFIMIIIKPLEAVTLHPAPRWQLITFVSSITKKFVNIMYTIHLWKNLISYREELLILNQDSTFWHSISLITNIW